jgi:Ulp1 protease family, C-terminal catalytic domain
MVSRKTRKNKTALSPGPYQCHPRIYKRSAEGCIPTDVLQKVAVKLGVEPKRKAIEKALGVPEKAEWTFLQALPLPSEEKTFLASKYLRPRQPESWSEDPDKWLDSLNIEAVMKQYEEAYPDFEFMGPFPIDFAAPDPYKGDGKKCLIDEVCELRVTEAIEQGTKHVGIIYNLDPHFKNGSHWVAVFIDIAKKNAYYFDSYGLYPPPQIATFLKWLTTQDKGFKLSYNGRKFQHKNTECGMYSLYFIIRMIAGDKFRPFTRRSPPDGEMLKLRHWIFST